MASGGGATSSVDMVGHQKNAHGLLMLGYDSEATPKGWSNSTHVDVSDYETNPSVLSFLYNVGLTEAGGNPFEGVSGYAPDDNLNAMETAVDIFETEVSNLSDVGDWSSFLGVAQSQQDSQIPGIDVEAVFNSIIADSISNALASMASVFNTAKQDSKDLSDDIATGAWATANVTLAAVQEDAESSTEQLMSTAKASASLSYEDAESSAMDAAGEVITDATTAAASLYDIAKDKYEEVVPNMVSSARGDVSVNYETSENIADTLSADIISDATAAAGTLFDTAKGLGDSISTDAFNKAREEMAIDHVTALDIANGIATDITDSAVAHTDSMVDTSISIADRVKSQRIADVTADATDVFSAMSGEAVTVADALVDTAKDAADVMRAEAGTEAAILSNQLTNAKLNAAEVAMASAKTAYGSLETDAAADVLTAFGVAVTEALDKSELLANSDAATTSAMGTVTTQAAGDSAGLLTAVAAAAATATSALVTAADGALLGSEDLAELASDNILGDTEDDVASAISTESVMAASIVDNLAANAESIADSETDNWFNAAGISVKANSKDRIASTYDSTLSAKVALDEFSNKANTLADSQVTGWVAGVEPTSLISAEGMIDSLNTKTIGDAKIAETVMDSAFDQADADALQAATTNLEMARSNLMADIQTDSKTDAEVVADAALPKAHTAADTNITTANQVAIATSMNLATAGESTLRAQAKTAMSDIIGAISPDVSGVIADATLLASNYAAITLHDAMDAALSSVSEDMLSKTISSYRKRQLKTHLRSVNRFAGGMADINAVNSSAFIIGMALLESDFEQNVSDFQTNVELTLYREGLGKFSDIFSTVLTEDLKSYHLRFADNLTAYQVSSSSYEKMLLTEIPVYLQSYTQTVGQYIGLLAGTYGESMQLGAGMTQIQAGLIQASLGARVQIMSELARLQMTAYTQALVLQIETRLGLTAGSMQAGAAFAGMQVSTYTSELAAQIDTRSKLFGDILGAEGGLVNSQVDLTSAISKMRQGLAEALVRLYGDTYKGLADAATQSASSLTAMGFESSQSSNNSRSAIARDLIKEYLTAYISLIGQGNQTAGVFGGLGDEHLKAFAMSLDSYKGVFDGSANANVSAITSALGSRMGAQQQSAVTISDAFSKVVDARLALYERTLQAMTESTVGSVGTYMDATSKGANTYLGAVDNAIGKRLGANAQDSQIRADVHSKTSATYLDTLDKDLAVQVDAFTKVVGSRLAANMQDSQVRADVVGRMSGTNLAALQQDITARLNSIVGLLNNKIEAYKTDVATNLAAFDKNMGGHLDVLEKALIAHFDGKIKTYLSDSNERSTFVRDGVRTLQAAEGLRLSAKQALMAADLELEAKKIVAHVDQYDRDLEVDVKNATWDMELFQGAGNVLSAVTGSVVQNAMKPSKSSSAIAGMFSGAGGALGAAKTAGLGVATAAGGLSGVGIAALAVGAIGGGLAGALQ